MTDESLSLPHTAPLFPLPDAVLFPNVNLGLFVFEPRYRSMLNDALKNDGIIGMEREGSLGRFLNAMPSRFEPATGNPRLNGVVVSADHLTGRASAVRRISYSESELHDLSLRPAVRGTRA